MASLIWFLIKRIIPWSQNEEGFPFHISQWKESAIHFGQYFKKKSMKCNEKWSHVHLSVCTSAGDCTIVRREKEQQSREYKNKQSIWDHCLLWHALLCKVWRLCNCDIVCKVCIVRLCNVQSVQIVHCETRWRRFATLPWPDAALWCLLITTTIPPTIPLLRRGGKKTKKGQKT